ncbi:ATP-binding cassette domain-containing protein [Ktedonospora formicarum]|uniref:ATP-binding cassette domain-containing protein n=1 Tax=Ktedonospora formicarum TaxID=2778364 RepID=UPI001C68EF01
MQSTSIQVKDLTKSRKKPTTIKGVNFTVEQGTNGALPSSNGTGKTTIVKLLKRRFSRKGGTLWQAEH